MLKRFLRKKITIPLGAILAGGIIYASISVADYTPGTYLDTQTWIAIPLMRRLSASSVTCGGLCRTAQAAGANEHFCKINETNQSSFVACLSLLNTDCTPQAVLNCASGERQ